MGSSFVPVSVRMSCLRLARQTTCNLPTVDNDALAGDEGRLVGSQKCKQSRQVLGMPQPAQWQLFLKGPAHFWCVFRLLHRGHDKTRTDRVHTNFRA
jgi:hypothetical protein